MKGLRPLGSNKSTTSPTHTQENAWGIMVCACSSCALVTVSPSRRYPSQPDAFSFNTAIAACGRGGEWRRSLDILAGMEVEGVPPSIFSYNAAIGACAKAGQWRIGLELLMKVLTCFYFCVLKASLSSSVFLNGPCEQLPCVFYPRADWLFSQKNVSQLTTTRLFFSTFLTSKKI